MNRSLRPQSGQISIFAAIVGATLALFGVIMVSLFRTDVIQTVRTEIHTESIAAADAGLERAKEFLRAPLNNGTPSCGTEWGTWRCVAGTSVTGGATPTPYPSSSTYYTEIPNQQYQFWVLPGDWTGWKQGTPFPTTDGKEVTLIVRSAHTKTGQKRVLSTVLRQFFGQYPWGNNAITTTGNVTTNGSCVNSFSGTPTAQSGNNCPGNCQGNVAAGGSVSGSNICGTVVQGAPIVLPTVDPAMYLNALWIDDPGASCLAPSAPRRDGWFARVRTWMASASYPKDAHALSMGGGPPPTNTPPSTSTSTPTNTPFGGTPLPTSTPGGATSTPAATVGCPQVAVCESYSANPTKNTQIVAGGGNYSACLTPGDYVLHTLELRGNAIITLAGGASATNKVRIFVTNYLEVGGNLELNWGGDPLALEIYVVSGATFTIAAGNPKISAIIYAPTSNVNANGNITLYGALAAASFTLNGSSAFINYPEQNFKPNIPAGAAINASRWREEDERL